MKRTALLILAAVLLMSFVASYPAAAEPSSSSGWPGAIPPHRTRCRRTSGRT